MTDLARQYRLHKHHLQQQLKEWNDMEADSTTVRSLEELQIRSDLLIRMQKEPKELIKHFLRLLKKIKMPLTMKCSRLIVTYSA